MKYGLAVLVVAVSVTAGVSVADKTAKPGRGLNNASKADYSFNYGSQPRRPRNYDAYYNSKFNGYELSPYAITQKQLYLNRTLGPVRPYSEVEAGNLVLSTLNAGATAPSGSVSGNIGSIISETSDSVVGSRRYRPVETKILDVMDRGVLLMPTREEVRLRGVRIPSEKSTDDVTRLYGREATKLLREVTQEQIVYVNLDDPVRDSDGMILGNVFLSDGTDLNRLMVERGYGQVSMEDFSPDVRADDLVAAEQVARSEKVGVWSRHLNGRQLPR